MVAHELLLGKARGAGLGLALLLFSIFLVGCVQDPYGLQKECGTPSGLTYACVVNKTVTDNKPEYCFALGGSLDDPCMQDYYEAKNDSSVCNAIPKEGVKKNCVEYYRAKTA